MIKQGAHQPHQRTAGFWIRLMSHNIDLIILLPVYYLLSFWIDSNGVLLWVCLAVTFLYEVLFISSQWKGTPGKRWMKIEVVNAQAQRLAPLQSLLRATLKACSSLTLFIGFAVIVLHPEHKSLHDLILGHQVIFSEVH